MTTRLALIALVAAATQLVPASIASAAGQIGKVAAVVGRSSASGPGGDRDLKAGSAIFEDDKIVVPGNGNAQIILNDNTRLVVGPASSLVIDRFLMKGGNKAQKISVKALRGTFRFITGRSNKNAYDIQTATATIGIRGTGFDLWSRRQTGVAVLQGNVELCSDENCVNLESDCEVGRAGQGEAKELTRRIAGQNIINYLPFIINQSSLRTQFRLPVQRCNAVLPVGREGGQGLPPPPPQRGGNNPD